VIQEARAEERRRLVTDRAAYETAVQRTARELAAEGAQLTSSERSA
jgi:hypothetical protein